jgi:tRNA (guanine-N7-)-methyltransferase
MPTDQALSMPDQKPKIDISPCFLDLTGAPEPLSWPEVFGNDHPVELEVGSGKGLFLQNAASACPGHNFVGVELSKKYARRAAERMVKRKLENVRVWPVDARVFLNRFVGSLSLHAVHVYFPDPWWKARHKKRRVFAEPLLADVERSLVPGGYLRLATDVEEYFQVILELVATRPRFVRQAWDQPESAAHELDYLTNFERKYRLEGRPIHRAAFVLERPGPESTERYPLSVPPSQPTSH